MEQHLPQMLFAPVALVPGPQVHLSYGLGKIMKVKVGKPVSWVDKLAHVQQNACMENGTGFVQLISGAGTAPPH
jgi:hypothetical protein